MAADTYSPPSLKLLLAVLLTGGVVAILTAVLASDPIRPVSPSGAELPPSLISDTTIQREMPRSPRRVVLEWSRSLQFSDTEAVAQFSSAEATREFGGRAKLDEAVRAVGPTFGVVSLVNLRNSGDGKATVRAVLKDEDEKGRALGTTGVTFLMTRTGKQWQLDDLSLLKRLAEDAETKRDS